LLDESALGKRKKTKKKKRTTETKGEEAELHTSLEKRPRRNSANSTKNIKKEITCGARKEDKKGVDHVYATKTRTNPTEQEVNYQRKSLWN